MPGSEGLPTGIWEEAETKEMEDVVGIYGKTYHFWLVDRGDKLEEISCRWVCRS